MKAVKLIGGRVENNESRSLQVEIPAGMTGKRLQNWKKRNEPTIVAAIESGNMPIEIETGSEEPGDSNGPE